AVAGAATGRFLKKAGLATARALKIAFVITGRFLKKFALTTGHALAVAGAATGRFLKKAGLATARALKIAFVITGRFLKKSALLAGKIFKAAAVAIGTGFAKLFKTAGKGAKTVAAATGAAAKTAGSSIGSGLQSAAETTGEALDDVGSKLSRFFTSRRYRMARRNLAISLGAVLVLSLGATAAWQLTKNKPAAVEAMAYSKVPAAAKPAQAVTLSIAPRDKSLWSLILANTEYALPADYEAGVTYVNGPASDQQCDERILDAITRMFDDAAAAGCPVYFRSGYRSLATQTYLFNSMKQEYMAQGMTEDEAYAATKKLRNLPGHSEHETGLAADIVPRSNPGAALVESLENTPELQWLHAHSAEYGFILRYPKDKTDITGTNYEPWHFRYVGVEDAKKITENDLTLEEYLGTVK
ncbi:MAG: M15 family metallopeptidase, partial [Ruthenibacterium sp.]